jgi:hypothetical protein
MFNDISGALDQGGEKGSVSKRRKANLDALLRGLGLSPEELKALRFRLSQVSAQGTIPGTGVGAFGFATGGDGRRGGDIIVNGNIVVQDPRDADAFVRAVQKKARRRRSNRRGVNAGVNLGLG